MKLQTSKHYQSHGIEKPKQTFWPAHHHEEAMLDGAPALPQGHSTARLGLGTVSAQGTNRHTHGQHLFGREYETWTSRMLPPPHSEFSVWPRKSRKHRVFKDLNTHTPCGCRVRQSEHCKVRTLMDLPVSLQPAARSEVFSAAFVGAPGLTGHEVSARPLLQRTALRAKSTLSCSPTKVSPAHN